MPPIPHGNTPQQRRQYATTIQGRATFYYDSQQQTWMRRTTSADPDDVKLVEVWQQGDDVYIHPGRNKFFLVSTPQLRIEWHNLALNPRTETIRKHHPVPGPPPPPPPPFPPPPFGWAVAANVIGYTSRTEIDHPNFNRLLHLRQQGLLSALPSVYYWSGHKTNDHTDRQNIRWDNRTGWQCLFFGNIPTEYVLYP